MSLQELLGEELYEQLVAKLGDKKVAIVSDGTWIPKDKFDTVNKERSDLKDLLKDRDQQLKDLGDKVKGNEDLEKQIKDLQKANEDSAKDYQAKLDKQTFDFTLERALVDAQAKNPKAVKALLNTETIKLDGETLLGLEDQLKKLKETEAYLFGDDKLRGRGSNPGNPNNPLDYQGKNPWKRETLNLTLQAKLLTEDPELAKQLQAQAK